MSQYVPFGGFLRALTVCFVCVMFGLVACAPTNTLRLLYSSATPGAVANVTAQQIVVVLLNDQRRQGTIGERADSTPLMPNANVADWISRSFVDELGKQGLRVAFANTQAQAQSINPDAIVTGTVQEVWLKENNAVSLNATIRLTIELRKSTELVFSESLSASQERMGLPTNSTAETLLRSTLNEVLQAAVQSVMQKINIDSM